MNNPGAGFFGGILMPINDSAHPLDLTGQIAIVSSIAYAGVYQFVAVQGVGSDRGQYHPSICGKSIKRVPVVTVANQDVRFLISLHRFGNHLVQFFAVSAGYCPRQSVRISGREILDDEFAGQIRRYRLRGSSGKVNLALDRLPEFSCRPGDGPHLFGDIAIAPSIDYLERAYDEAKYGDFSRRPYINVVIPSLVDPSVAPPGKHVMSCFVQYAPYDIKEGPSHWPERSEAFGDAVVDTLAAYIPGLKDSIRSLLKSRR